MTFFSTIKRNDIFNAIVIILTSFQAKPLSSPTEKPTLTTSVGNRIWWKCLGTTGSAPWFGPSPPQSFRTMASTGTRQRPGSKRVPKTDEVCVGIIQPTLALVKKSVTSLFLRYSGILCNCQNGQKGIFKVF